MLANTFELIYDILSRPVMAFYRITHTNTYKEAVLVFLLTALLSSFSGAAGTGAVYMVLPLLLMLSFLTLLDVAVTHLCTALLGGKGDILGLLRALPSTFFPSNFLLLLPLLSYLPPALGDKIIAFLSFVFALWSFILKIIAITQNYNISNLRAFIASILPVIAFIGFFFALFFFGLAAIFAGIAANPDALQGLEGLQQLPF